MKEIKGMNIIVRFGEIEVKIEDTELDIENISPRDLLRLIKVSVKSAANQVISIQRSLHDNQRR